MKKLSIITINYNNRDGLRKTIESVVAQTTRDYEYIVIDGGSTDGSVDVIKEYEDYIDYWVSEPDKGIYNAMNKGVAHAHGEYCNFLNSGDTLYNLVVIEMFNKCSLKEDIQIGASRLVHYENKKLITDKIDYPHAKVTTDILLVTSIGHGPAFIKTTLLKDNPYDESLKIVSDWKFYLEEIVFKGASYHPLNFIVDNFDMSGCSNTQRLLLLEERDLVLRHLLPTKLIDDYKESIYGRTKLERIIKSEKPDGCFNKILTFIAVLIIKVSRTFKQ